MKRLNVVDVQNLSVSFGKQIALSDITFTIQSGKFTGLIGPNGAGKSTLLKTLLGLVQPDSGTVKVFGHPPGKAHNLIGYVPQTSRFEANFPITARGVIMMGRYSLIGAGRFPGKKDSDEVDEAIELVGISELADKKFGMLSGGAKQKVLIARSIASKPRLLLLDEPATGVDAPSQDNFYRLLHTLQSDLDITVVLVSHDIGVITSHVEEMICINQRVFCHGSPPDVVKDGLIGKAYGADAEVIMHDHNVPHRTVRNHQSQEKQ
ncbi:hypothetical protein MNBD_NITROSPINAE02-335 [hydrothermal vent metagenome]|uniref:ABC transporter domain-containing protein n=1 Tax=hydrothermal vent metagenome TaxID=652676 RepID=A0A3B1CFF6_9ZZZZ